MRLPAHVLLVTAISDVGLSSEVESETYHLHRAKTLVSWEELQLLLKAERRHDAAVLILQAAAHLCHAADKILFPVTKPRRL